MDEIPTGVGAVALGSVPASLLSLAFRGAREKRGCGTRIAPTPPDMAHRWHSILPVVIGVCAGFGIGLIIMGCSAKANAEATRNAVTAPAVTAPAAVAAGLPVTTPAPSAPVGGGERQLDTSTPAPTPAPVTTFRSTKPPRKPGSDENLPAWVPLRGRLSVVEAPDLAENLGIVPKGATKSSAEGRISVADALDKNAAQAATAPRAANAAQPSSATWLAANGRMRHGRGR